METDEPNLFQSPFVQRRGHRLRLFQTEGFKNHYKAVKLGAKSYDCHGATYRSYMPVYNLTTTMIYLSISDRMPTCVW